MSAQTLSAARADLERAISILEGDRLAMFDLNLARGLLRRVDQWEAELARFPVAADIIMGEHSMWEPLIRITVEDADKAGSQPVKRRAYG